MKVPSKVASLVAAFVLAPTAAHAAVVADWHMDESAGAGTMADSSAVGGQNNGRIVSVQTGVPGLAGGRAYQFGGSLSHVEVPDADALDPGAQRITLSATVRVTDHAMTDDSYDLVRKGIASTAGGYWKMEINRRDGARSVGRLRCVFKGVLSSGLKSEVMKIAAPDIVDGRTHRLQCIRDGSTVRAVVDGSASAVTKPTGSIANAAPVFLGAKKPGDDVLQGTLDQVSVSIG